MAEPDITSTLNDLVAQARAPAVVSLLARRLRLPTTSDGRLDTTGSSTAKGAPVCVLLWLSLMYFQVTFPSTPDFCPGVTTEFELLFSFVGRHPRVPHRCIWELQFSCRPQGLWGICYLSEE